VSTNAVAAFGALGDPTRRAIFELVATHPLSVGAIALEVPVSRPAVSQHLKVLKDAGLVTDHADGTRRVYEVDRAGLDAIHAYFDRFWNDALSSFKRAAELAASQEEQ
jgi:DNA-binding transcriptional ArsR family regulator